MKTLTVMLAIAVIVLIICNIELSRRSEENEKEAYRWKKAADQWMEEAKKLTSK